MKRRCVELTEAEHNLMWFALENLRIAGLAAYKIARQHEQKKLEKIAEGILKKHGALETEYGKMLMVRGMEK